MNEEALIPYLTRAILWWDRVLALPGAAATKEVLRFLIAISSSFWFLSRVFGWAALQVHDNLDYSLAVLFAVFYNIALALLFASVMAAAIYSEKHGAPTYWRYQAGGFIVVYFVLSMVYMDREGKLDDYGLLGYAAGLVAFLVLILRPRWTLNPVTAHTRLAMDWLSQGWPGRIVTAIFVYELCRRALRVVINPLREPFRRLRYKIFFGTSAFKRHA